MKHEEQSTWLATVTLPKFPKLTNDLTADVAIIGGGLAGLLSAYELAKAGKKVVLLEKERVAQAGTGFTTGFLAQYIDTNTSDQVQIYGSADTKKIWESHGDAIARIEKIVKDEKIECEIMRCPNYTYANDAREKKELDEEYSAMKEQGFAVSKKAIDLGFKNKSVVSMAKQGKFHPLKFVDGLLAALAKHGVEIYEMTEIKEIVPSKDGGPFEVKTLKNTVTADWTITATYQPFNNPKEVLLKKGMYKSYIIELEVPAGTYPEATYEDMDNPYHYFRVDAGKGSKGNDRLLIGGEDHRVEVPMNDKNFEVLKEYAHDLFGTAYPEVRRWSGFILESVDGLPFIGEYQPHQLIATAFSGNGMTYSAISAKLFTDIITGKKNPYKKLYDPTRTPTFEQLSKKVRDFGEEFFRGAVANMFK